jgi:hypothetical protein
MCIRIWQLARGVSFYWGRFLYFEWQAELEKSGRCLLYGWAARLVSATLYILRGVTATSDDIAGALVILQSCFVQASRLARPKIVLGWMQPPTTPPFMG